MSSEGGTTVLFRRLPAQVRLSPEEKKQIVRFAQTLSIELANERAFTCLLTNDREIRKLNHSFLQHNYPTDVLSFPAADSGELGEIAISLERAREQAAELGHNTLDELRILLLHGVLHLLGMDHERDRGEMARAERKLQKRFGLPPTLIARSAKGLAGRRHTGKKRPNSSGGALSSRPDLRPLCPTQWL